MRSFIILALHLFFQLGAVLQIMFRSPALLRTAARRSIPKTLAARSLHASAPLREEEKAAAAPASGGMLSDIRVQLPIGFLAAIPLIQTQVFILNEETQLLGCFMVFVGTLYSQAGDAIGKALDVKGEAVIAEHNAQEEIAVSALRSVLAAHEKKLTLVEDMKTIYGAQSELLGMLAAAKSMELQYMLRSDIVKKLDYIAMKEESMKASMQESLVKKVSAVVAQEFAKNKDFQDNALAEAMATIADPTKTGDEVVSKAFIGTFALFAKEVASKSGTEVSIPADIMEEANSEIMALRKRSGNDDVDLSGFAQKHTFA